ncbi:unnamed protein product [Bathycoccus prasinos]
MNYCIRCCPSFSSSVLLTTLENRRPPSVFPASDGSYSLSSSGRKRSGDLRKSFTRGKLVKKRAMMLPEEYALSSTIPANEIAGFVIGFCMLYVVSQASKLDAIIASAQARSLARDDDDDQNNGFGIMDEKDESVERVKRGKGNVFILPPSESSSKKSGE